MKIVISGATGLIGKALCKRLYKDYELIAITRNRARAQKVLDGLAEVAQWDARSTGTWSEHIDGAFAVINLAGENIGTGYWTKTKKQRVLQSRLDVSGALLEAVNDAVNKPEVVIQASAIGYYGNRGVEELDENTSAGEGFLTGVCRSNEAFAVKFEEAGCRCVIIRTGVVLDAAGGALPKLMFPFKFFLGGHAGSGKQWFSWMSIDDEVSAIRFLIESEGLSGVFNLTAPEPLEMKKFCKILGRVIKRPSWTRAPAFALRAAFGDLADEMLLAGQNVLPRNLLNANFEFKHKQVESALRDILI